MYIKAEGVFFISANPFHGSTFNFISNSNFIYFYWGSFIEKNRKLQSERIFLFYTLKNSITE